MMQIDNTLQPDNLQENVAVQQAGPRAGEGKEDDFVMLPWQNKAHRLQEFYLHTVPN